jgi:hypothetical protein
MSNKELYTKIVKMGDGLVVPLTDEFVDGTLIAEGVEVSITQKKPNTFQIVLENLGEMKVSCQICGQNNGKYTCTMCGMVACPNCFWELGGLCRKCMKKQK